MQTDLVTALNRLAPANAGWVHDAEGPDDMPAHIKAMINGVSLHVPVAGGKLALGTWQGIYLAEHRARRIGARSCFSSSAARRRGGSRTTRPCSPIWVKPDFCAAFAHAVVSALLLA